jgi:hypothetical protein
MTPEFYILLGGKPETVGTDINRLRTRLIKVVLTDAILASLTGSNGAVWYQGCATGLARGRSRESEMGVTFTFVYLLNPEDL